ncbi:MAG: NADH-quinone oxidoreductase subunit C [Algoriphagus sp.]|jgi:NADH-quinone oxidoreductase subunit C
MDFSAHQHIVEGLKSKFGEESILTNKSESIQPYIIIDKNHILAFCDFLYKDPLYYFDFLNCITAIDNGEEDGTFELWYHLTSIPFEKSFIIKVLIERTLDVLPTIHSLESIWKTADWHERETYDLFGINFLNHPDLRRILLPADWEGYPLRKDYVEQEKYHGIKVKY